MLIEEHIRKHFTLSSADDKEKDKTKLIAEIQLADEDLHFQWCLMSVG